jgi:predicted nucleic acid-binding protein
LGRVVLDTSILIALEKQQLSLKELFNKDLNIYLPEVAVGEYLVGSELSTNPKIKEQRLAFLRTIEDFSELVVFNREHAQNFAKLVAQAKLLGRPRGSLDLAIAASAVTLDAVLYTRDSKGKFDQLIGLTVKEF